VFFWCRVYFKSQWLRLQTNSSGGFHIFLWAFDSLGRDQQCAINDLSNYWSGRGRSGGAGGGEFGRHLGDNEHVIGGIRRAIHRCVFLSGEPLIGSICRFPT
jgi:hypothetical protein